MTRGMSTGPEGSLRHAPKIKHFESLYDANGEEIARVWQSCHDGLWRGRVGTSNRLLGRWTSRTAAVAALRSAARNR